MKAIVIGIILLSRLCYSQVPDTVKLSHDKYVYMIFDADVVDVQLGSSKYFEEHKTNMVTLKAVDLKPAPTTLMVRTKNNIYVWMMSYSQHPPHLKIDTREKANIVSSGPSEESKLDYTAMKATKDALRLEVANSKDNRKSEPTVVKPQTVKPENKLNIIVQNRVIESNRISQLGDLKVEDKMQAMLSIKREINSLGIRKAGLYLFLENVRVDENYMYLKVGMENTTSIAYEIDYMGFERLLGGKTRNVQADSRSIMPPKYFESVFSVTPAKYEQLIYVFELFAFDEKDKLRVHLYENKGDRQIEFDVPAKTILTARHL